jgi:chromosomal replication initiator protein
MKKRCNLQSRYTFDNFIIGLSNYGAYSAAKTVAESLGNKYNPFLICGGDGLGKTHLLNAIGNYVVKLRPSLRVIYMTAEDLTLDIVSALREEKHEKLEKTYGRFDLLLVDDLHVLQNKTATQAEFSRIFNVLLKVGKQIVLASDGSPIEIKTLIDVHMGHVARIREPELETKIAIIRQKAEVLKVKLSEDVIQFLAIRTESNIRWVEGSVTKLKAHQSINGLIPDLTTAKALLTDVIFS